MALLRRKRGRQSPEDREQLRRRLQDLEEQREERLAALGGLAADLHRRNAIDAAALSEPAAAIVALEDEMELVRRGLDEGLSEEQLKELAEDE
jgi:hypothetical protein